MPIHRRVVLHRRSGVLWDRYRGLEEALEIRDTRPPHIWKATYQGVPSAPGGTIFQRAWWNDQNRYLFDDRRTSNLVVRRWLSCDTAGSLSGDSAYTAILVGELLRDYRLLVREVVREKVVFPDLPAFIESTARRFRYDRKLAGVVIENKSTGTPAIQTFQRQAEPWLRRLLWSFDPLVDKATRARFAASWCRRGCVLLPYASEHTPWLIDFEEEVFSFAGEGRHELADQVDSFTQLLIQVEPLLQQGYWARRRSEEWRSQSGLVGDESRVPVVRTGVASGGRRIGQVVSSGGLNRPPGLGGTRGSGRGWPRIAAARSVGTAI